MSNWTQNNDKQCTNVENNTGNNDKQWNASVKTGCCWKTWESTNMNTHRSEDKRRNKMVFAE
jgi:hypothetical protein